jgi:hypothetical protein
MQSLIKLGEDNTMVKKKRHKDKQCSTKHHTETWANSL